MNTIFHKPHVTEVLVRTMPIQYYWARNYPFYRQFVPRREVLHAELQEACRPFNLTR